MKNQRGNVKKYLTIIFGIGIPLGIFIVFIKTQLHIEDSVFWRNYVIMGAVAFVIILLINFLHQLRFFKRVAYVSKHFKETGDVDWFMRESERWLEESKSDLRKSFALINLSYGHARKKQFAEGLEVLDAVNPKKIKGINRSVYFLNKIYCHFYLNQYNDVIALTEEQEKEFEKYKTTEHLERSIAANHIYYCIAKGEQEQALTLIQEGEAKWGEEEAMINWDELREKVDKSFGGC